MNFTSYETGSTGNTEWPGYFTVKIIGQTEQLNEAHVICWRWLDETEQAARFALCGMAYPDDPYEQSQVDDMFTADEVEAIRRFVENDAATIAAEFTPATKPVRYSDIAKGEDHRTGMTPFADMYCGIIEFDLSEYLPGLVFSGTITHYITKDGERLSWDSTSGIAVVDQNGITFESDENRVLKEFEENSGDDSDLPDAFKDAFND